MVAGPDNAESLDRPVRSRSVSKQTDHPPGGRPLLMSLRPRFAQAILDGVKTVELRRTRVSATPGTTIIIYASSPVMSVVGVASLLAVETGKPSALWRRHRRRLGLTRAEFDAYLDGTEIACCLSIGEPVTLPAPYALAWLRDQAAFRPPQSYRYLAHGDPEPLHLLAGSGSLP